MVIYLNNATRIAAYGALAVLFFLLIFQPASAAEYTVSPSGGEFAGIQAAITHASAGDTIIVQSGNYQEKIRLDKPLTLRGMDTGGGAPVIDPEKKGNAVEITANGCTVSGFVIQNAELLSGIRISADRTTITSNTVKGCSQGLFLASADKNLISGNNITRNARTGISLEGSGSNWIENNAITKNTVGLALDEYSVSNTIFDNTIENTVNVLSRSVTSDWDSGTVLSYHYLGREQRSRMGNYWSDYRGRDTNGDGIGDTPYVVLIGANKKAVLVKNQDVVDAYPLMDPTEFYTQVSDVPPVSIPATTPAATRQPVPKTGDVSAPANQSAVGSLFKPAGWFSPAVASLLVFIVVSCISGGVLAFLRRLDLAEPLGRGEGTPQDHPALIAIAYGVAGIALAILSVTFMITLAAIPPSNPVITGAWLLCALCIYLSISSFTLAYGVLRSELYPSIATPHGILAALAVPAFALIMIYVPDRREIALFAFIFVLAISAAIPFWQYGKHPRVTLPPRSVQDVPTLSPGMTVPGTTQAASTTSVPGQTGINQPPVEQMSYFPRELENKYYDITCVGKGGIAWVYAAKRKEDGKGVAVKIPISFDEITGKSFLNEIKAWEMLRHPNIVEVSAVNILPVPYVEMEYVAGSLETIAKPIPVWKAVYIVRGIADALRYAHSLGIIHRDIKPHNILVTGDLMPKITDWGMSKVLATDIKKSSITGFSLSYAAPEQVSPAEYGRTDARTDIYQLGVVFYELVTGSIPFGGESMVEVGNAILREQPAPPSDYAPEAAAVDRIILRCLEKDPALRYQTAGELLDALSGYLDEEEP